VFVIVTAAIEFLVSRARRGEVKGVDIRIMILVRVLLGL